MSKKQNTERLTRKLEKAECENAVCLSCGLYGFLKLPCTFSLQRRSFFIIRIRYKNFTIKFRTRIFDFFHTFKYRLNWLIYGNLFSIIVTILTKIGVTSGKIAIFFFRIGGRSSCERYPFIIRFIVFPFRKLQYFIALFQNSIIKFSILKIKPLSHFLKGYNNVI